MDKFPKSFRMIEIEQQCRYGFTQEYVQELCKWSVVQDFAWIVHDKDHDDPEKVHIHCLLRFKDSVPTSAIVARISDIGDVQQLERIKKGWKNALAYLCHWNRPEKYQYDPIEVHSNYDWQPEAKEAIKEKDRLAQIINKISTGEYKRYNITDFVTTAEWVKFERQIESAFRYQENIQLRRKDRQMEVMYLYGGAGVGKTTFAKKLCENHGEYFISSSGKDFLDGYSGQPCIILDDFRGSQATLSTILKLLDNNTASSVESRYKNKSISECKFMVITSVLKPYEMFQNVFKENNEPYDQFKRRIGSYVEMNATEMKVYRYDKSIHDFQYVTSTPNLILDEINKFKAVESKKDYVKRIFGAMSDLSLAMVKSIDENDMDFDNPLPNQMDFEGFEKTDDIIF